LNSKNSVSVPSTIQQIQQIQTTFKGTIQNN